MGFLIDTFALFADNKTITIYSKCYGMILIYSY